jgi:multiple sugar transport system substrate-binding protein
MNMKQLLARLILLAIALSACRPQPGGEDALRGRILLWHGLAEGETAVLEDILAQYEAIHPGTKIISVAVAPEALRQQYAETASLGLGPDLLLAPAAWAGELAEAELLRTVESGDFGANDYSQAALASLRAGDAYLGLPFALEPAALVVNRALATVPPESLAVMLGQADAGFAVGLNLSFDQIYWGIGAFGDPLVDVDGRLSLADSGLEAWLDWLKTAQETAGVVLLRDDETLGELFLSGRLAYLVAGPDFLPVLAERMDLETLSVVPLPAGPAGEAAPLIHTEALMLNAASSRDQARLALAVAQFLTNTEQSTRLMRENQIVPANRRVRVDRQVYPLLAGFVSQSRQATALPPSVPLSALVELGDTAVTNVLAGVLTPEEAVCQLVQAASDGGTLIVDEATVPADCR